MPLDHKGNYHMNPHRARMADNEKPGSADPKPGVKEGEGGYEGEGGDGAHHHEIHESADGSAHSTHTHPDGQKEEMDHASYADAVKHESQSRGGEAEAEPDGDETSTREPGDDMAGMYASHCE